MRIGWFFLLGLLALIAWYYLFCVFTYRYEMVVTMEADGKAHVGKGIVEVRSRWQGQLLAQVPEYDTTAWGEAPVVDLGKYGIVIAVLEPSTFPDTYRPQPQYAKDIASDAFYGPYPGTKVVYPERVTKIAGESGERFLTPRSYPGFVWLRHRDDVGSAVPVSPSEMPGVIDPSVRVVSVSIEMTRNRPSEEIYKRLLWLERLKGKSVNMVLRDPRGYKLLARDIVGDE